MTVGLGLHGRGIFGALSYGAGRERESNPGKDGLAGAQQWQSRSICRECRGWRRAGNRVGQTFKSLNCRAKESELTVCMREASELINQGSNMCRGNTILTSRRNGILHLHISV